MVEPAPSSPAFALVGPGRAGTTIGLALQAAGYQALAVAGRAPDAASTRAAAAALGCRCSLVSEVGHGAATVIIATPDAAIERTAEAIADSLEPGSLVVHLAGSRGIDVFDALTRDRPDVRVGALHPLQTLPGTGRGVDVLAGSWAAVAGDARVAEIAEALQLEVFEISDADRARYHATAVVASNHLVALIGQVERMAKSIDVPLAAFAPLLRAALENAIELGPTDALTGPVARGDLETVERHLAALSPADRDAYRAMAREAARLSGRRLSALDRIRNDVDQPPA